MHHDILHDPGQFYGGPKLLKDLADIQERWTFGFDPVEAGLPAAFGLTLLEDLGANDYRSRYIPHRTERGYEFYRVAVAQTRS